MGKLKILNYLFIGTFLLTILAGCSAFTNLEGSYSLIKNTTGDVVEFSSQYEIIEIKKGNKFTKSSYYNREYIFSGIAYSLSFAGQLVENASGKYQVSNKTIKLEWFIGENKQTEEYKFDKNSLYNATYYSDGSMNEKTKIYSKTAGMPFANFDGKYQLNLSKSNYGFGLSSQYSPYLFLNITDDEFTFNEYLSNPSDGKLVLGYNNALIVDNKVFEKGGIVIKDDENLIIKLDSYDYFLYYIPHLLYVNN